MTTFPFPPIQLGTHKRGKNKREELTDAIRKRK